MADPRRSIHSAPTDELPDELYIGFVDGLLVDVAPVFLSALTFWVGYWFFRRQQGGITDVI